MHDLSLGYWDTYLSVSGFLFAATFIGFSLSGSGGSTIVNSDDLNLAITFQTWAFSCFLLCIGFGYSMRNMVFTMQIGLILEDKIF